MSELSISAARQSIAGIKPRNEDACGLHIPQGGLLKTKGIAAVIADGMSGSDAGKEASDSCVRGFLADYYSTPESWTVKTSGQRVLGALNRWLHGQGQHRFGSERGMVSTISVLVIKSTTAYLFHVGDTRIYRLRDGELECLTRDHRMLLGRDKSCLTHAMGIDLNIEIDYRTTAVEIGDVFLLSTDGVHDVVNDNALRQLLTEHSGRLDEAAAAIIAAAQQGQSQDNISCQVLRIEQLPDQDEQEFYRSLTKLPFPPPLEAGMILDGYRILREMHASKRTQVYLAEDTHGGEKVVMKTPSVNYQDDPAYIDRFLHEEWVGRRIHSPHVLRVRPVARQRKFLYYVSEHIEGQTLRQWLRDHTRPNLQEVRVIAEQIAAGLRAFHRLETLHQDLKPENIMLDLQGRVKIIDFGSTKIAGIDEISSPVQHDDPLGTQNYTAPEYLQGQPGSNRSDIYSLGVISYELLTGHLPYGAELPPKKLAKAQYTPATVHNPDIPAWVDAALERAVHREPQQRYPLLSEFIYDLSHPNPQYSQRKTPPLMERNPLALWRGAAIGLFIINIILFYLLNR